MIPEAIAAAESVVRALLWWIVAAAVLATAALYALVVAGWAVWRATVAAVRAVCAWLSWRPRAELPPCAPTEGVGAPGVVQARSWPSWSVGGIAPSVGARRVLDAPGKERAPVEQQCAADPLRLRETLEPLDVGVHRPAVDPE